MTRAVWDKMESACGATVAEIKQYGDGVMGKSMVSRSVKKPCACCHKLFADDPALEAHWELVQHSAHDAVCASCGRHFPSYDTLRQHLIGKLPKESCAAAFATRGCKTCLEIFENEEEENAHACVFREREGETQRVGDAPCVALDCEFVGVGEDGSENACARVCIVDAWGETKGCRVKDVGAWSLSVPLCLSLCLCVSVCASLCLSVPLCMSVSRWQ